LIEVVLERDVKILMLLWRYELSKMLYVGNTSRFRDGAVWGVRGEIL